MRHICFSDHIMILFPNLKKDVYLNVLEILLAGRDGLISYQMKVTELWRNGRILAKLGQDITPKGTMHVRDHVKICTFLREMSKHFDGSGGSTRS